MTLPNFDPESRTGAKFLLPVQRSASLEQTAMQDWLYDRDVPEPCVRNYKVNVLFRSQEGATYTAPLLSIAVESVVERGRTFYKALWTADCLVFGYGDSEQDAIKDMADFLVNDLVSLQDEDGIGLTPKAIRRRDWLRGIFGIPS